MNFLSAIIFDVVLHVSMVFYARSIYGMVLKNGFLFEMEEFVSHYQWISKAHRRKCVMKLQLVVSTQELREA